MPAEPEPVPAANDPVVQEATNAAALVAAIDSAAEEPTQPPVQEVRAPTSVAQAPEEPVTPHEPDADLELMFGGELVRVIVGAGGEGPRAARAYGLLDQRGNTDYLLDDLELLCRSGLPEQQLQAARVIRNLPLAADEWGHQRARDTVLRLVNQHDEPAVVAAALATLETFEGQADSDS